VTGFGGTLKNVGMGGASKGGKLELHSNSKPSIDKNKCIKCLRCFNYCQFHAIKKVGNYLEIDHNKCSGCAGCIALCPVGAIRLRWDAASADVQQRIARYAASLIKNKNIFYINFLINITPNCDCYHTDEPVITNDVGIFASFDPVCIDKACYDFIRKPLGRLYPDIDPMEQIFYAEKFGAGEKNYEIKNI
jgi:hypothetical protein